LPAHGGRGRSSSRGESGAAFENYRATAPICASTWSETISQ
jgi:hypothetical protein